jgi:methyl-accepting chemotaxis protein
MRKRSNRRKRLLIDKLQYRLLIINVAYFFVILLMFAMLLYAPVVMELNSDGPSWARENAAQQFLFLDGEVWLPLLLTFACLTVHSIFMSHRIAGPLYQLRRLLGAVGEGNLADRAVLRDKDYLRKGVAVIHDMIDQLSSRISSVEEQAGVVNTRLGSLRAAITTGSRSEVLSQLGTLDESAASLNSLLGQFKVRHGVTSTGPVQVSESTH